MKTKTKTVYLIGPIEFMDKPDADWRYELENLLKEKGIESINPVTTSFLVGKNIEENLAYSHRLKKRRLLKDLEEFMDKIWAQNKKSVDAADALVLWVRTEQELEAASKSGGTIRELCRANTKKKPAFLICECNLTPANSHFLHLFLKYGQIVQNTKQFFSWLDLLVT